MNLHHCYNLALHPTCSFFSLLLPGLLSSTRHSYRLYDPLRRHPSHHPQTWEFDYDFGFHAAPFYATVCGHRFDSVSVGKETLTQETLTDFSCCEILESFAWVEGWHFFALDYSRAEAILTDLKSRHKIDYQAIHDDDAAESLCYPSDFYSDAHGREE